MTGLGTSIDALTRATVVSQRQQWQNPATLETLYYEDDLIAKGVDAIVDDAMRHGFDIELRSSADVAGDDVKVRAERITRRMRELQANPRIVEAAKWGRLYGGGAVFVGSDMGDPKQMLNPRMPGRIRFLATMERRELWALTWCSDFDRPNFARPQLWSYYPTGVAGSGSKIIDASRLLMFEGLPVSKNERAAQAGHSLSVVTRVYEVIRDGQQNWRSMCLILQQMHQAVYKLKNLVAMVGNNQAGKLQQRMEIVNLMRSISRAVIIDADSESFDYHSANVSGLADLLDRTWQRVAGAFDMPVTRLMGISPGGLGSTGEGEQTQWYDRVQAYRENQLEPSVERLIRIVAAEQGDATPGDWCVKWPSLWQMSPTAEAAYRKTVADTDGVYIDKGVVTPEEVTASRFGGGGWSAETYVDLELRASTAGPAQPGDEGKAYPAKPAPPVVPEAA